MSRVSGPVRENGEGIDRPELSDEDMERALQISFEARDPRDVRRDSEAMIALRARFKEIAAEPGDSGLTQRKAIAVLRAISERLGPATQISRGLVLEDDPAIEQLDELIDALADLQRGKPNVLFATEGKQAHRALGLKQLREDEMLLRLVEDVKRMKGCSTKEAEKWVARSSSGRTRGGRKIDLKTLQSLRRHKKAKTPVALLEHDLFYKSRLASLNGTLK
jgi:hypothetical protein